MAAHGLLELAGPTLQNVALRPSGTDIASPRRPGRTPTLRPPGPSRRPGGGVVLPGRARFFLCRHMTHPPSAAGPAANPSRLARRRRAWTGRTPRGRRAGAGAGKAAEGGGGKGGRGSPDPQVTEVTAVVSVTRSLALALVAAGGGIVRFPSGCVFDSHQVASGSFDSIRAGVEGAQGVGGMAIWSIQSRLTLSLI